MHLLDLELPDFEPSRTGYEQNHVRFYKRMVKNEAKSAEAGRAIVDAVDFVEILIPGDRSNVVDRPVRDEDKRAYHRRWGAYLADKDQDQASGTLLALLPGLPPERAEEYALMKMKTAEQLASASDNVLQKLGPFARKDQERCKQFLEALRRTAPVTQMQAELEKRDAEIDALKRNMADLMARLGEKKPAPAAPAVEEKPESDAWYQAYDAKPETAPEAPAAVTEAPTPKRRGRPRKTAEAT